MKYLVHKKNQQPMLTKYYYPLAGLAQAYFCKRSL